MLSRKQRQLKEVHLEISIRMAGWQDAFSRLLMSIYGMSKLSKL
jgi:hypothetical protein